MENTENIINPEETIELGRIVRKSIFPSHMKKSVIFNAQNDAESLSKAGVDVLTLAGVLLISGSKAVTHEPCINTYLITDEGHAYVTQSDGIRATVERMLDMYEDDVAGIVIRIVSQDIGNGRTRKIVRIMD